MKTLSEEQKQIIRAEFYQNWRTCSEEMVKREKRSTVTSTRQPVLFALREVLKNVGLSEKIDYRPHQDVHKLVNQLDLKCPTCGRKLDAYSEVGKYLGDEQFSQSLSQSLKSKKLSLENSAIDSRPQTTKINSRNASGIFAQSAIPPQPTVACIDDSLLCLKVMEQILSPKGYQFIGIQDAWRTLPTLISSQPHLIFLDIGMPGLNGYEICDKLRQVSQLKNAVVIMLTDDDASIDRSRARIVGASGFLAKPIDVSQVIKIVEKFFAKVPPLERNAEGVVQVGKTGVTLDSVIAAFKQGATAEEIVYRNTSLNLANVYATIGFYLNHQQQVEAYLQQRRKQAQKIRPINKSRFDSQGGSPCQLVQVLSSTTYYK